MAKAAKQPALSIRPFKARDRKALIALWNECGLTRPWNPPDRDIDFCLKVRTAGYRNLWTPFAELYHHESASRGADDTPEKAERFQREVETMLRRWGPVLQHDPAYNPNLTLEFTDFSLASPPRPRAAR